MLLALQIALATCGLASWWPLVRAQALRTDAAALPAWDEPWLNVLFSILAIGVAAILISLSLITHPMTAAAAFPVVTAVGSLLVLKLTGVNIGSLFRDCATAPRMALLTLLRITPFIAIALVIGNWIFKGQEEPALALLRHASVGMRSLTIISAVLLAPIGEELFFRGLIYRWLRGRMSVPTATGISAILFAVSHMAPASAPALLIFGFAAAYSAELTGGLMTPILFHIFFNLLQVGLLFAS